MSEKSFSSFYPLSQMLVFMLIDSDYVEKLEHPMNQIKKVAGVSFLLLKDIF